MLRASRRSAVRRRGLHATPATSDRQPRAGGGRRPRGVPAGAAGRRGAAAIVVGSAIAEAGAEGPQAMGAVMKVVQPQVAGRADGGRVAAEVNASSAPSGRSHSRSHSRCRSRSPLPFPFPSCLSGLPSPPPLVRWRRRRGVGVRRLGRGAVGHAGADVDGHHPSLADTPSPRRGWCRRQVPSDGGGHRVAARPCEARRSELVDRINLGSMPSDCGNR